MNTKQRRTVQDMMRKNLRKEYFYLRRELLLTCPVDLGKLSADPSYAAFDKDGISIYTYSKEAESRMKLVRRHPWSSFRSVKMDQYLTRTELVFQGDTNWVLLLQHKGKELRELLEQYTALTVEEVPRPFWRKVPGYRSNVKRNMYAASLLYAAAAAILLKLLLPYSIEKALFAASIGIMLLGLLCLTIGMIDPTIVLPKLRAKTRENVFYLYSFLAISGFVATFVFW
ncbi:hypothetical protein [Ectobacillus ponti]|uniref:Uncharacterized protein n=1 Tax=Ectobacillus ponti TaxID=2961894 RepID=A0AA41X4T8_9BACI|nr:hypothetical protein [Ectobacillus ponti]MCP8968722.1 hypothetical protein [Ectobacillus ponti]